MALQNKFRFFFHCAFDIQTIAVFKLDETALFDCMYLLYIITRFCWIY